MKQYAHEKFLDELRFPIKNDNQMTHKKKCRKTNQSNKVDTTLEEEDTLMLICEFEAKLKEVFNSIDDNN